MQDTQLGIYDKYEINRKNDPTGKHRNCFFFVLDIEHDSFARAALLTYALLCKAEYPQLCEDLLRELERHDEGVRNQVKLFDDDLANINIGVEG